MTADGVGGSSQDLPLSAVCSSDELDQIAARASTTSFPVGSVLVREGEIGREFTVIAEGNERFTTRPSYGDGHGDVGRRGTGGTRYPERR